MGISDLIAISQQYGKPGRGKLEGQSCGTVPYRVRDLTLKQRVVKVRTDLNRGIARWRLKSWRIHCWCGQTPHIWCQKRSEGGNRS